jgi:hypothetical protein
MLWIIEGNQGGGKTVFAVKEAFKYYKSGMKIYSNIHLNFPYEKIKYDSIIRCEYENAVILLDEIHQLLGSRTAMSKKNNAITSGFCSMLRKKGITLLGTTQRIGKIDKRLRSELTFLCKCERYVFQNNRFILKPYDDKTTDKNTPTFIKVNVTDVNTHNVINHYFCANEYFKKYNSKEIVFIEGIDDFFEQEKTKVKKKNKKDYGIDV